MLIINCLTLYPWGSGWGYGWSYGWGYGWDGGWGGYALCFLLTSFSKLF
jgi:hypothetical protein